MERILPTTMYLLLFYIIAMSAIGDAAVSNDNKTNNQQCHYDNSVLEEKFQILTIQLKGMVCIFNKMAMEVKTQFQEMGNNMAKEVEDANYNQTTELQEMKDKISQLENLAAEQRDTINNLTIQLQEFRDQKVTLPESITTEVIPSVISHKDCASYRNNGVTTSGIYVITPIGGTPFNAYCDMESTGGGWLVFQRRQDGSENFYRNWTDYQQGFGSLNNEFWLGNDNIASVTDQGTYELRVDLEDFNGYKRFAVYSEFSIDKSDKYRLTLWNYRGDAGDSLRYHNGYRWSTFDQDNNGNGRNCASEYKGAWWYYSCLYSNLNGMYLGADSTSLQGVIWYSFSGQSSLKMTEMKVRPAAYTPPV